MDFFTTVTLQAPYSHMLIWKIVMAILLAGGLLLLVWPLLRRHIHRRPRVKLADGPTLEELRAGALDALGRLQADQVSGRITNREAYQRLSGIVRSFVRGATGIRVTNYTYEEIRELNMPQLTALVHDYYEPEFARDAEGEFTRSHSITTGLIKDWR